MVTDESIPNLADKELGSLHANALRLSDSGNAKLKTEATRLLPLIEAELAARKARAPTPRARKTPVRKKAAAKES